MERLLDFTNSNPDDLRELITLYLTQTGEQISQLAAAIQAASPPDVRRLAHSCAGASATCGMTRIVLHLREMERRGDQGTLSGVPELFQSVQEEFQRIRVFLEDYLADQENLAAQI